MIYQLPPIEDRIIEPGCLVLTPGASETHPEVLEHLLGLHLQGDWGDVSEGDTWANDQEVSAPSGRVLSSYRAHRLWIITEWSSTDRVTTILRPEEY